MSDVWKFRLFDYILMFAAVAGIVTGFALALHKPEPYSGEAIVSERSSVEKSRLRVCPIEDHIECRWIDVPRAIHEVYYPGSIINLENDRAIYNGKVLA